MNKVLILNFIIPIIIKTFIPDGRYGSLTINVDLFIIPISLLILNLSALLFSKRKEFFRSFILMFFGMNIGDLVGYTIWGLSNSRLLNPDPKTILLFKGLVLYHSLFTIISFISFYFLFRIYLVKKGK
ncbi:hypothetical protein [Desulfosarcina ovata]|uniref:hypothetical protein n=1 Tax=Desulfosarcina ovata TaxID=83564 RepID=UPI0012D2E207|nr:hypothetical protein [Desulfosarcina ovata]